jgi:hypothetical protein
LLWSLRPPRLYGIPATLGMLAKYYAGLGLKPGELPDPEKALRPRGLAGICAEMNVPNFARRLRQRPLSVRAYRTAEMVCARGAQISASKKICAGALGKRSFA